MSRTINRIDRVTAVVRPENLEPTIAKLSFALQTAFSGPFEHPDRGARIAVAWDAGIELVAPASDDPGNRVAAMLAAGGERWVAVKFGVRDLDASCARLARLGYEPTEWYSLRNGYEPWCDRFRRIDEACFDPVLFGGLPVVLCTVEEEPDPQAEGPRRTANRIDHVVAAVRPENLEPRIAQLSFALQTAFHGPFEQPQIRARVAVAWDAGVELVSPLSMEDGGRQAEAIERYGERWGSVVFGVRDLDETCARLAKLGHEPRMRFCGITGFEPWCDRFQRFDEAIFDTSLFGGLPLVLSTIEERADP